MVDKYVVRLVYFSGGFFSKSPYRSGKRENPNRRAYCNMVIGGKVCRDFFDRHCPTVHTKVPAPPKTKSTVRFFSGLYFIKHCAGSVCFLKSFFANIAHSGKIYHKAAFVFADVWVIRRVYKKALLLLKKYVRQSPSPPVPSQRKRMRLT